MMFSPRFSNYLAQPLVIVLILFIFILINIMQYEQESYDKKQKQHSPDDVIAHRFDFGLKNKHDAFQKNIQLVLLILTFIMLLVIINYFIVQQQSTIVYHDSWIDTIPYGPLT